MRKLPAELGFRMPAEWEPHEATWIAWPHHRDDWPGKFAAIPWVYAEIVRHLHQAERVCILVNDARSEARARRILRRAGFDLRRIAFVPLVTNRVWTRDYGPLFVRDLHGAIALTDWQFNAWAKYPNWQDDDAVPAQMRASLACRLGSRSRISDGWSLKGAVSTSTEPVSSSPPRNACSLPSRPAIQESNGMSSNRFSRITWAFRKCSGSGAVLPGMTRMATWTT